jgi:FkbM family methyltransferase
MGDASRFNPQATREDILYCFRLLLGRHPNPEELAGHTARAGEDLKSVVASYLSSAEFAARDMLAPPSDDSVASTRCDGFSVFYDPEDLAVGKPLAAAKSYEPHVQAVFRSLLRPGMSVLDVGANIGYFSLLSASLVGPTGRVIAIEPNSRNVRLLEASRQANNFENIELHCVAAHTRPGILVLNISHSNGTVREASTNLATLLSSTIVPAMPIDTLIADRRVDFLKIDVEGAELRALQGARATLARYKPVIVSEYSHTGIPEGGDAYLSFLTALGYSLGVIAKDGAITWHGQERAAVVAAFWTANKDHIDIVAQQAC